MTTTLNAVSGTGLVQTSDGSGIVKLQSNSVTTNALAWVNFNGVTTATIRASYNVSSVTRNGTGDYTVNFATALADANYVPLVTQQRTANGTTVTFPNISSTTAPTTSAVRVGNDGSGATTTSADAAIFCVVIFGN